MTTLLTILGFLKPLLDILARIFGKFKRDAIIDANKVANEAREQTAKADMEVAVLKAEVKKNEEEGRGLEEIKGEEDY